MFSRLGDIIYQHEAVAKTADFTMGIEVEMHRIDNQGNLSQEPYPLGVGDQKTNPWITNDFLNTMTETIAPPANESVRAMQYIYRLNNALRTALAPGELLWPLSMPPRLPEDKTTLTIAKAGPKKEAYFKEWVKRYGWEVGIPCGVHINISLNQHLIDLVLTHMGDQFQSPAEVRNYIYTNLAQGFARYRWLFTYLFGASPVAEANFYPADQAPQHPMRSLRQSGNGLGS